MCKRISARIVDFVSMGTVVMLWKWNCKTDYCVAEAKNEKFRSSEGLEATEEELMDAFADTADDEDAAL
jgi:hypothetical protein